MRYTPLLIPNTSVVKAEAFTSKDRENMNFQPVGSKEKNTKNRKTKEKKQLNQMEENDKLTVSKFPTNWQVSFFL